MGSVKSLVGPGGSQAAPGTPRIPGGFPGCAAATAERQNGNCAAVRTASVKIWPRQALIQDLVYFFPYNTVK